MTTEESDDLRATAESIVADAERLKQIELQKLKLSRGGEHDAVAELSERAEQLSEEIATKARAETQLAEAVAQG